MSERLPTTVAAVERDLPQGVVTFLFSDIEGSTSLLVRHREAMGRALARHHELLAEIIADHEGVVFETVGDAVYGAFAEPGDAIAAAVAIQRRLGDERFEEIGEVRVRIAVHTGPVERRGRHYYGAVLFENSRIEALAHGGQTLTSAHTAALVAAAPPDGVSLRPLGRHRLEDLDEPMEVVQVDADGLLPRFPPLRTAEKTPSNLPHEMTSFVGRAHDLARLGELIERHRLVTLLGPGGTGKTRLALEIASRQLDRFPDGVWLVELAPIASPELVVNELADVWGLRAGEGNSLEDVVKRYLATRHLLLVVDNCEHVREAAATLLHDVLAGAPAVSVLATSRETLGLPGETEYRVPPLPLPDADEGPDRSDAVRLFLDRVRSVRPDIVVSEDDLAAIVRACRRLEGMPLGLELAAARIRTLSPTELADRLDSTFRTLGSASKVALPHQRTLEATLDWSYGLLTQPERAVFRRLSVFAGSFDIDAAEAVCGDVGPDDVLTYLGSLVDKSLVLALMGATTRFRLLEPIRQYGLDRLAQAGESAATGEAHAKHYAAFVAEAAPHTRGPDQMAWERRLDTEYDNIRVALASLLEAGEVDRYLAVGFDLFVYWMHLGLHVEGIAALLAGLRRASESTDVDIRLKAWFVAAGLGAEITDPTAIGHAREGLELARSTGDPNAIGRLELQLGAAINHSTTDPEYLEHLLEGRRLLEAHPEPYWWEPEWERGLINLVLAAYLPPEDERLQEHVDAALAAFEAVGDQALLAATLADSAGLSGQADDAWVMANVERAVEILGGMRVPYWHGHALLALGALKGRQDRFDEASAHLGLAAVELQEMGDLNCWAAAVRRKASIDADRGRVETARAALAETIEALPLLPMAELHTPLGLDAAAKVLAAAGMDTEAAITLGRARAIEVAVPLLVPREPLHEAVGRQLEERLGAARSTSLLAEGEGGDTATTVAQVVGWLRGP
jgi:predicted ATPase/class 3 adenylate cyclase